MKIMKTAVWILRVNLLYPYQHMKCNILLTFVNDSNIRILNQLQKDS